MDSQSSSRLWQQTDFSSWVPRHKFFEFKSEFRKSQYWLRDYYDDDTPCDCHVIIPGNKIPKWFNHESVESSISLWVGSKLPTFALCVAFCLADEDEYDFVCVVDIFINGHKGTLVKKFFFEMHCDHQWFHGASHRLLQEEVGNLIQGDRNHIELSCKISCWTSETGGQIAPTIARMGVHVKCICSLHDSVISHEKP